MDNKIFDVSNIVLDCDAKNKTEVLKIIATLAKQKNIIDNSEKLISGFEKREKEASTHLGNGFAIPHCKSDFIKENIIILVRMINSIKWDDNTNSNVKVIIALIVKNKNAGNLHLDLLASIAKALLRDDFRNILEKENDKNKIVKCLFNSNKTNNNDNNKSINIEKNNKFILAVCACPVGIAHTYMAQENLEKTAKELGYEIKVEAHTSSGIKGRHTTEDINKADTVIMACNIKVDSSKYYGKKIYFCGVEEAVKKPKEVIEKALNSTQIENNKSTKSDDFKTENSKRKNAKIMKDIMYGVSYMIPIVIVGGIFLAFSIGLSKAIYGASYDLSTQGAPSSNNSGNPLWYLLTIGNAAFTLMIPILGAFIAYSIGGKAAFAPALVLSFIGNTTDDFFVYNHFPITTPGGFLIAIAVGVTIGYLVNWMNNWNLPKTIRPLLGIFIAPLLLILIFGPFIIFLLGPGVGYVMGEFGIFIKTYWSGNLISSGNANIGSIFIGLGFGLLIGAMAGFDMGGPVNKIAFLTCTGLLGSKIYTPMGSMACAIPCAPLGMGISTLLFKNKFDDEYRSLGITAIAMGCIGISEGAIPFAIRDPKRAIPSNILGSAIAGGLGGILGIADVAGHGGPIVGILGALGKGNGVTGSSNEIGWAAGWEWTLVAFFIMIIGAFITATTYGFLLTNKNMFKNIKIKKETKEIDLNVIENK